MGSSTLFREHRPQDCIGRDGSEPSGLIGHTELLLEPDDVNVADVEDVRNMQIRREVLLFDLEADNAGVLLRPCPTYRHFLDHPESPSWSDGGRK